MWFCGFVVLVLDVGFLSVGVVCGVFGLLIFVGLVSGKLGLV